jgi:lipopolysaccharide export system permease protein
MKLLKLYIFREFIPPYIGSMAFFSMLLLLERVLSFVRLVARGYASVIDLSVLIFFSIPSTLALTMPMATLMGALVSVSRLSHDSEITAMRASGIRLGSIFVSLYLVGILIGGLSFYFTDKLVPIGNIRFRTLYQKLTIARPDVQFDSLSINQLTGNVTMLVDEVDEKSGDLLNVTLFERNEGENEKTITAKKGWFVSTGEEGSYMILRLQDGTIFDPGPRTGESFDSATFSTLDLNIPIESKEIQNIAKSPRDMSMKELTASMVELERGTRAYNKHVIEYHKKIAIPFACILFVFLGTPFAITRGRTGRGLGLGIGVIIIFLYYLLLLSLERIGKSGTIPPWVAVWLPNMLFFMAGMYNILRRGKV